MQNLRPISEEPTHAIMARIRELQSIQKGNSPTSIDWLEASDELRPLFAEMARRFPAGAPGLTVEDGGEHPPVMMVASVEDADSFWGTPISVYTRAQAIADGVLIDVTEHAKSYGIKFHTVLTAAVWNDCVAWDEEDNKRKGTAQDETGRLLDVLAMAAWRMRAASRDDGENRAVFSVLRTPRDGKGRKPRAAELVVHIGPGDHHEPVITIMFPGED